MLSSDINEPVEWRDIVGFEGVYQVSSHGQVRNVSGRIRKPYIRDNGYHAYFLHVPGTKAKCLLAHSMVLLAFVGERPARAVVRHLNGNPGDNRLSNLVWGTQTQNGADCRLHGRTPAGERNTHSKLDAQAVKAIRSSDLTDTALAAVYGVRPITISKARRGITWTSI